MCNLTQEQFNRCVDLLTPYMDSTGTRQALLTQALFNSPLLHQITYSGPARTFTINLVRILTRDGCDALFAVLTTLKEQVGITRQQEIDALIEDIRQNNTSSVSTSFATKGEQTMIDQVAAIGFLIEIGRWAKAELSERWKLRRAQQETDLTKRSQAESDLPAMLQDVLKEQSERDVERTLGLIERKRDAIYRARNARLADREEYDAQKLAKSAFEHREAEHNKTIRQMLHEIEADLEDLGFDVEREAS